MAKATRTPAPVAKPVEPTPPATITITFPAVMYYDVSSALADRQKYYITENWAPYVEGAHPTWPPDFYKRALALGALANEVEAAGLAIYPLSPDSIGAEDEEETEQ